MSGVTVDIGKSGIRCWIGPDTRAAEGLAPEFAAAVGSGRTLADGIRAVWSAYGSARDPHSVHDVAIGTTFLPEQEELARAGADLARLWPHARIAIVDDGVLAHAYALGGPGTIVSAGTGAVVIGFDVDGQLFRVDGWGPDAGDRGSAWAIGVAGLRAVYRERDGVGPATRLTRVFADHLGGEPDLTTATRLFGAPDRVRRIADFAVRVLAVAAAGDGPARAIVDEAVDDLVAGIVSVARRTREDSVAIVGGLTRDSYWTQRIADHCRRHGLNLRTAGSPSTFDPAALLRTPYRTACAWWHSPG